MRQTRNQLTRVLSLIPVVTYSLRIEGGEIVSVWNSDNITRVTGYPREETLSIGWWLEHIHPDDTHVPDDPPGDLGEEHIVREFRFRYADGSYGGSATRRACCGTSADSRSRSSGRGRTSPSTSARRKQCNGARGAFAL